MNAAAPVDLVRALACDPSEEVRSGAAANPAAPASVLRTLAVDPEDRVRIGVARNTASSAVMLESRNEAAAGNPPSAVDSPATTRGPRFRPPALELPAD